MTNADQLQICLHVSLNRIDEEGNATPVSDAREFYNWPANRDDLFRLSTVFQLNHGVSRCVEQIREEVKNPDVVSKVNHENPGLFAMLNARGGLTQEG